MNFTAGNNSINTNKLYFTPSATALTVTGTDSSTITMRLSYSATQYIDYIYSLKGTGYKVGLTIKPTGLDQVIANTSSININWAASVRKQEKDMEQERRYSYVSYNNTDGENDYLSQSKDDQKEITDKKATMDIIQGTFFLKALL